MNSIASAMNSIASFSLTLRLRERGYAMAVSDRGDSRPSALRAATLRLYGRWFCSRRSVASRASAGSASKPANSRFLGRISGPFPPAVADRLLLRALTAAME